MKPWGAFSLTLAFGMGTGLCSGLIERVALTDPEGSWVRWCGGLSAKMFAISVVLVLLGVFQWQRIKLSSRVQHLEDEIARLKSGDAAR